MSDPRVESMIAAVTSRYPAARVEIHPPFPEEIQVPIFLIVLDADLDTRRDAERLAFERMKALWPGEPTPMMVGAAESQRAAEFAQDRAGIASPARGE